MKLLIWLVFYGFVVHFATAQSRLNNDPSVLYLEEVSDQVQIMMTIADTPIHVSKEGGRRLGTIKTDSKVELLAFTEKAYRIKGEGRNGQLVGWTSPRFLASKDPQFAANLKKLYDRHMAVKELIANNEVAIGMSLDEVVQSVGEPTKKKVRVTATGQSGTYEYITYNEQKHYNYVTNPMTGGVFRQFSHVTQEETSKLVVEFKDDVVAALEKSENNQGGQVRVVVPPIIMF